MKNLAFIDIESTGVNVAKDRIVELAIIKVDIIDYDFDEMGLNGYERFQSYFDPEIPMEPGATEVTGITDEFLKGYKPFRWQAGAIRDFLKDCHLAGHNILRFDVPLLVEEFLRVGLEFPQPGTKFVDTFKIHRHLYPSTLSAVYELMSGKQPDTEALHGANADAELSAKVFKLQMDRIKPDAYTLIDLDGISRDQKAIVDFSGKLSRNEAGEIIYAFGKNEGKTVASDLSYARWMMEKDFTMDTKRWLQTVIDDNGKLKGQSRISF